MGGKENCPNLEGHRQWTATVDRVVADFSLSVHPYFSQFRWFMNILDSKRLNSLHDFFFDICWTNKIFLWDTHSYLKYEKIQHFLILASEVTFVTLPVFHLNLYNVPHRFIRSRLCKLQTVTNVRKSENPSFYIRLKRVCNLKMRFPTSETYIVLSWPKKYQCSNRIWKTVLLFWKC